MNFAESRAGPPYNARISHEFIGSGKILVEIGEGEHTDDCKVR
jgi:hypothetical protein